MSLTFETGRELVDSIGIRNGFTPGHVDLAVTIRAYVNDGRWVADCPWCSGARMVNPEYPFWCVECGGSARVEWPAKKEMREISDVLEQRPRANQNWHPDEHARSHPTDSPYHEPCIDAVVWLAYENDVRGIPIGNDLVRKRYEKWIEKDWAKRGLAKEMAGFNVESK